LSVGVMKDYTRYFRILSVEDSFSDLSISVCGMWYCVRTFYSILSWCCFPVLTAKLHRDFAHSVALENGASAVTWQEVFGTVDPLLEVNVAKAAAKAGKASRCVIP
jgi:hypothetical protein